MGRKAATETGFPFIRCDVSREPSVRACVRRALKVWPAGCTGQQRGIAAPGNGPLEKLALSEWNRRIGTNLTGVFLMTKHAAPHLRRARGAVVNIASTRALQSEPDTEAYAASKGGMVALTHALALSLGPRVRVNCVSSAPRMSPSWSRFFCRMPPASRAGRTMCSTAG
jgi:NAD(P)-dependent dehydrogenase (short-subunit alcohol dehydrogenase family)